MALGSDPTQPYLLVLEREPEDGRSFYVSLSVCNSFKQIKSSKRKKKAHDVRSSCLDCRDNSTGDVCQSTYGRSWLTARGTDDGYTCSEPRHALEAVCFLLAQNTLQTAGQEPTDIARFFRALSEEPARCWNGGIF